MAAIDGYRRSLQRAWLETVATLMTEEPPSSPFFGPGVDVSRSDVRPILRADLQALRAEVQRASARVRHAMTRVHLADLVVRIDELLEARDDA